MTHREFSLTRVKNRYDLTVTDSPTALYHFSNALLILCGSIFRGRACRMHRRVDRALADRQTRVLQIPLTEYQAHTLDPEFTLLFAKETENLKQGGTE